MSAKPIPRIEIFRKHYSRFFNHAETFHRVLQDNGLLDGCKALLSIGAGEGHLEIRLARERAIRIGYVDSSAEMASAFTQNIEAAGVGALVLERHFDSFQTFAPRHRYDLALAIYSWFSIGHDRRMIEKVFDALESGGRFFLVVPSETEPMRRALVRKPKILAEEYSAWATAVGFPHRFFRHTTVHPVDSGELISNGAISPAAKDFVAFRGGCLWDDLSPGEQRDITGVLVRAQAAGRLDRISGCLVFEKT